jgi:hypothetical protein
MRLSLIVICGLAFAPAYAAIDSLPLGVLGGEADNVRSQIVEGIAGVTPAESASNRVEVKN